MELSIEKIANRLKIKNSGLYVNRQERLHINHVKKYKADQGPHKRDVLFVIKESDLLALPDETECFNLLCPGRSPLLAEKARKLRANLLLVNQECDIDDIVDGVQAIIERYRQLLQDASDLFDLHAEGKGLQQILNKGYEMLGNIVLLSDTSMSVMLYSENAKSDDDLMQWIFEDKNENYNTFYVKHRANRGFEKSFNSREPVYISRDLDDYAYLAANIFTENKLIAHLVVVEYEKPFEEDDSEIIMLLCKIISLEMQKDNLVHHSRGYKYESLFIDLLEGRTKDPLALEGRIKSLDIDVGENLYVFTAVVDEYDRENTKLPFIRNLLEDVLKNGKSVIYNDQIVCLLSANGDEEPFGRVDLKMLTNFLKSNNMFAGISYRFHRLEALQTYYRLSLKAIETGRHVGKESIIFPYEDNVVFHLLDAFPDRENLGLLCHPSLMALIEYDKKNSTNFAETLYTFLTYEKNQIDTANALFIHRSTLLYRIKKAEEIMNVSLKDNTAAFKLLVSFKILKFLGEF